MKEIYDEVIYPALSALVLIMILWFLLLQVLDAGADTQARAQAHTSAQHVSAQARTQARGVAEDRMNTGQGRFLKKVLTEP